MKFRSLKKKAATAALAALVTMALSSGSVVAAADMPTGGELTAGSVTIGEGTFTSGGMTSIGDLTNDATLEVHGNSIIKWDDFSIGKDYVLNINTADGALLNRVVGSNLSEIMGTLNQTGCNPMLLINPNGIVVGANATINASELVLSTLDINSDEAFLNGNFDNGVMYGSSIENPNRKKIVFEKGAVVNFQKPIDAYGNKTDKDGFFTVVGGSIEVADGVTFWVDPSDKGLGKNGNATTPNVDFCAADGISLYGNNAMLVTPYTGNTLNFAGSLSGAEKVKMIGHDVTLSGEIIVPDDADSDVSIIGTEYAELQGNDLHRFISWNNDENNETYGTVNITSTGKIIGADTGIDVAGGKTTVAGQLKGHNVGLWAVKYYSDDPDDPWGGLNIKPANVLDIQSGARIEAIKRAGDATDDTGNVYLIGSTINKAGTVIGNITTIGNINNGSLTLDQVSLKEGKNKANEILSNNADFASQKDSFVTLAEALNETDKTMDEKISMVAGIVMTIADDTTTQDKYALTHAVLSTFDGTKGDVEASDNSVNVTASDKSASVEASAPDASAPIVADEVQDVTISE